MMKPLHYVALMVLLALPSLIAEGQAPKLLSANDYMQFEERQCPRGGIPECVGGMAHIGSLEKTCFFGVSYWEGHELSQYTFKQCISTCSNGDPLPNSSCSAQPCSLKFQGKRGWQAASALDAPDQEMLADLYKKLIALITAADQSHPNGAISGSQANNSRYLALGGDQERENLKKAIVAIVLDKMIPFTACMTPYMDRNEFKYPLTPMSGPHGQDTLMEMHAFNLGLTISEKAFFKTDPNGQSDHGRIIPLYLPYPDQLATAFIHEAVHFKQRNESGSPASNVQTAHSALKEVMAYEQTGTSTFYKINIKSVDPHFLDDGLQYNINLFKESWIHLDQNERKELAKWAWVDESMRRMMTEYPNDDASIWMLLCVQNTGLGPCGVISKSSH